MFTFNTTNIFQQKFNKFVNYKAINNYVDNVHLNPFQIHSNIIGYLTEIKLLDRFGNEILLYYTDFDIKKYKTTLTVDGAWYIYEGGKKVIDDCLTGTYQLKVKITNKITTEYHYSNFFTLIDVSTENNYLYIGNSVDFNNMLFNSDKFYHRIHFRENQIKNIEKFKYEDTQDNGDGTNTISYQNFVEQKELKFIVDKNVINEFENIRLFDICKLYYDGQLVTLYENPTTEIEYNEQFKYYIVTITMKISNIDKGNCENNINASIFTDIGGGSSINNLGDAQLINNTDKLLIN